MIHIIAYDIADNKRRLVAKTSNPGAAIQELCSNLARHRHAGACVLGSPP